VVASAKFDAIKEEGSMRKIIIATALLALCASSTTVGALDSGTAQPVVVTPIMTTAVTSAGQPIILPQGDVEVTASMFEIAAGAKLPVHKHPFPRYGYMIAGTLKVTNAETGESKVFKAGDFIVEMVDRWHWGANVGADRVKLLVIDQVTPGTQSTLLRSQAN
jgi:quercetin dioxygenase-like cupin family protein